MELTEKQYWENFWDNVKIPHKVDLKFSNDANIASILNKFLINDINKQAFEVGCAPGKWLVYLADKFSYQVDGCEYIEAASKVTRKNLDVCGIKKYNIYTGDFFKLQMNKQYDVVLSLGFIEHFEDVDNACRKHADLLKKDGILIFGVPKITGLNYYIAQQVDKSIEDKLIPNHNLKIMNLEYFENLDKIIGCKKLFVNTIGGFEPALFNTSKSPLWFKILFYIIKYTLDNPIFRKINHPYYASYIMGVYKKVE